MLWIMVRWFIPLLLALASILTWIAPENKPNAVLGRLNYLQFWLALAFAAATLSALVVALIPAANRRKTGFKVLTIWIGFGLALLVVEWAAYLWPAKGKSINPWYYLTSESTDLPFERPPHFEWRGLSRGDLTLSDGIEDPNAQMVSFRTDMQGFHNNSDLEQADLVVIGDSFAEAGNLPVEDNFTTRVGARLGLQSRNLGRAGYTAPTELIVLKKYGLPAGPKIVVWQIAASNDLAESVDFDEWIAFGRKSYGAALGEDAISGREAWRYRSPTYFLFAHLRNHDPLSWPFDGIFGGTFKNDRGKEVPIRFLINPSLRQPARGHPGWGTFSSSLLEGAAACQTRQIQLVVVLIPSKFRVYGPYTKFSSAVAAQVAALPGFPKEVGLAPILRAFCGTNGISFIDTTPALKEKAAAGKLVYLPFDTHLSALGHQVVADLLVSHLLALEQRTHP